jgi:protein-S-isoprenylcysteine O-methyltransferase Ste14
MKRSALMVTIVPLLAIAYLVYAFARPPWTAMRIVGLTLMTSALILLTIARIQLGNSFSVAPQATQLVTHGIYSRIRNPVYVFGTFVFMQRSPLANPNSAPCLPERMQEFLRVATGGSEIAPLASRC